MDAPTNRQGWAERSGEFSPTYYAHLGPNKVSRSLLTVLEHFADENASILEVGCSAGRHLAYLQENGYETLSGVDINDASFTVMAEAFPELAETGTFHTGSIETVVPTFPSGAFDIVYSVETLQHVHSDDTWVFEELVRVAGELLVTVEKDVAEPDQDGSAERVSFINDEFPLYRRDWRRIFTELGLDHRLEKPDKRNTIHVFGAPEAR